MSSMAIIITINKRLILRVGENLLTDKTALLSFGSVSTAFEYLFTYSFNKHLLNVCCVPGISA